MPDPVARAKSARLIAELFQSDLAQIRNTQQEAAYAAKLLKAGTGTADDPAGRFELFEEARAAAAHADDIETAMQAVEQISQTYRVNGLLLAANTLEMVAAHLDPQDAPRALPFIDNFVNQAVGADRLDLAKLGADIATELANKSKDRMLIAEAEGFSKEIDALNAAFHGIPAALARLAKNPADPDANLVVGRYYCLYKVQWGALEPLSRGSDPVLKQIAGTDLAGAADAHGMMVIGDGWWDWAESQAGIPRQTARQRAVYWYEKASPKLEGLSKLVVDHRLFEVRSEHPDTVPSH